MLSTIPIKKRIKILFQLNCGAEDTLYLAKISHILSQHNVFESHLVDEFFIKLFKSIIFTLSKKFSISIKAYITINKISYYYKVKSYL